MLLGEEQVDAHLTTETLPTLLKYQQDIEKVRLESVVRDN